MMHNKLFQQIEPRLAVLRRFLPAIAFFCGFIWDSVTMGRVVSFYDLLLLTTYYFGAGLILVLLVREIRPQWENWFIFFVQFFFGGLFSALVVFYFKSAGSFYTFFVVIGLVCILVGNEFLAEKYRSRSLSWAMLAACGTMYLNFLIPHIAHSVKPGWFYLSCVISLILVFAIHAFASVKNRETLPVGIKKLVYRKDLRQMIPAVAVVLVLVFLYQVRVIPPVPLVLKESYICKNVNRVGDVYQGEVEKQTFWRSFGFAGDVIHFNEGERLYCLVAVFAPTRIKVDLEHRWWLYNEKKGRWLARGVVPLSMVGGRTDGWRTYSYIQKVVLAGNWKVETALKEGAVLAIDYFKAEPQMNPPVQTHRIKVN